MSHVSLKVTRVGNGYDTIADAIDEAIGDQMKHTLNKIMNFFRFEPRWKHLWQCKCTTQQHGSSCFVSLMDISVTTDWYCIHGIDCFTSTCQDE